MVLRGQGAMNTWRDVCYLLVIRSPDTAGYLAFQIDLGGPVSLPADRSHQDKTITV